MRFIGRGELRASEILQRLLACEARSQVPLQALIKPEDFRFLDLKFQRHRFDLVLRREKEEIVCEVNFKHGDGTYAKWNNVFVPNLVKNNKIPFSIDDFSCRKLFNTKAERPLNWNDFRDVIDALEMVRIQP